MAAMSSPEAHILSVVEELKRQMPAVKFQAGVRFYWSPKVSLVSYNPNIPNKAELLCSLFHEVAHAKLQHKTYSTDFELLKLEVLAWEEAKDLATSFGTNIDEDYIQDCLDTYRDWLHKRSTCPTCGTVGVQCSQREHQCHNCNQPWSVTTARFCRPYRRKTMINPDDSARLVPATFH